MGADVRETRGFSSAAYWRRRYRQGGNSGAGSYGRLAAYKAEIINSLASEHGVDSAIEFGVGDGNQAGLFEFDRFLGVDVVPDIAVRLSEKFLDKPLWRFKSVDEFDRAHETATLSLSLDVIYHLVEDDVYHGYMERLFGASERFVLIYASDEDQPTSSRHVRHRRYSDWIDAYAPEFIPIRSFDHPYPYRTGADADQTSFAFFRLYERKDEA